MPHHGQAPPGALLGQDVQPVLVAQGRPGAAQARAEQGVQGRPADVGAQGHRRRDGPGWGHAPAGRPWTVPRRTP